MPSTISHDMAPWRFSLLSLCFIQATGCLFSAVPITQHWSRWELAIIQAAWGMGFRVHRCALECWLCHLPAMKPWAVPPSLLQMLSGRWRGRKEGNFLSRFPYCLSSGCCKIPRTGWLTSINNRYLFLIVLEDGGPISDCQHGQVRALFHIHS